MQDFEDAGVTVILASRIEVMVPMRDGVRLRTVVCAPRGARASGEAEKDGVKEPSSWLTAPWLRPVLDPAVKAYSPQAPPADNFVGDDLFHQGAFRLSPTFEFVPAMYRTLFNQRPLTALLFVSTTGPQIMVAAEMLRGRFRKGSERAVPITRGKVEEVAIDLLTRNHVLKKGHRVMVQVQSTWFPPSRWESADLRPEHLPGEGVGLPGADPLDPLVEPPPLEGRVPVARVRGTLGTDGRSAAGVLGIRSCAPLFPSPPSFSSPAPPSRRSPNS